MEIRPLQAKDVFTVARMLGKITKSARLELARVITAPKTNPTELGIALFQSIFTEAEEDIKMWMADLVGKPKEEFEKMPATAVLDIIEALAAREDIRDFFARASRLIGVVGKKPKSST